MNDTPRRKHRRVWIAAAVAAVTVVACVTGAWLYLDRGRSSFTSATPDRALYPVRGIDISAHNGVIDFERVRADSIDFVYIKATEGATFKDRMFADNIRHARRSGLMTGAYHFFRFDTPGHMQALNFMNSLRGRDFELMPAIDVEEWGNPSGVTTQTILGRLSEMVGYMKAHGLDVVIYTNKDGYQRFFDGTPSELPLWICSFTNPPGPDEWRLWQHSHRGKVDGIDGSVDLNTFNGGRLEFERWLSHVRLR